MKKIKYLLLSLVLLSSNFVFSGITISKYIIKSQEQKKLNQDLLDAVRSNWVKRVQELIEAGANVNAVDPQGMTPLMIAAEFGHPEMTQILIRSGSNLNSQNSFGRTALIYACFRHKSQNIYDYSWRYHVDHMAVIELLLKNGANPDIQNFEKETALMIATDRRCIEIIKLLLIKFKANIYIKNRNGWTAISGPSWGEDKEIVDLFERAQEYLVKEVEAAIIQKDKVKIRSLLKKYHDRVGPLGNTILHYAAMMNSSEMFSYICKHRPDLFNKKNIHGQIAIDLNPQILALCIYNKFLVPGAL